MDAPVVTVADGTEGGTEPLRVAKSDGGLTLTWEAETAHCTSLGYHLIWGWGSTVESHVVAGSECSLDASGSHLWTTSPDTASDWCWFLVLGNDGMFTESGWGTDSDLNQRSESASGRCRMSAIDISACLP